MGLLVLVVLIVRDCLYSTMDKIATFDIAIISIIIGVVIVGLFIFFLFGCSFLLFLFPQNVKLYFSLQSLILLPLLGLLVSFSSLLLLCLFSELLLVLPSLYLFPLQLRGIHSIQTFSKCTIDLVREGGCIISKGYICLLAIVLTWRCGYESQCWNNKVVNVLQRPLKL